MEVRRLVMTVENNGRAKWTLTLVWCTLVNFILLVSISGGRCDSGRTESTNNDTVVTTIDVAGSNREWFAIALCRTTCLETSAMLRLTQLQEEVTIAPSIPQCVIDTRDSCGPAINLTHTQQQQQKITCSSAEGDFCGETISEQVTDYDKCVQLCQNLDVQKSCTSSCSAHQFLLSNANLNETSQQTWVTAIVPLPPRPICTSKPIIKNKQHVRDMYDEEEDEELEVMEEEEEEEEEEFDCDSKGGVMVMEVWDSKGASLKWAPAPSHQCPPLHPQLSTAKIVYIVQMRQLLRLQPSLVADEWKTITATTHTSTSLKYVLTLGLHYQVRIIAVSAKGICSATQESRPFGLPKGHPSPGPPRNLRYLEYDRAGGGVLGNTIRWDPPSFGIPISHYLITWFIHDNPKRHNRHKSSESPPNHVTRIRHHLHSSRHPPLHPHVVIPGRKRTYFIRNLLTGHVYLVQVQAVARLGDMVIYGEPASIKLRTFTLTTNAEGSTTTSAPDTTTTRPFHINITSVNVTRIYFENGMLVGTLEWNYSPDPYQDVEQFSIRVHSQQCSTIFQLDHTQRREQEQTYTTKSSETIFQIPKLRFDCIYHVRVSAVSYKGMQCSEAMTTLETPMCQQVEVKGDVGPDCPPTAPHPFTCTVDRVTRTLTATCHWSYRHSNPTSLRGFLIIANTHQSAHRHGGLLKNTSTHMLVNKNARQVVLTDLVPNTKYYVTIRVVGANGLGPNAHAHFFASSPPFYHGSSHSVTFQAWRSAGNKLAKSHILLHIGLLLVTFTFYKSAMSATES